MLNTYFSLYSVCVQCKNFALTLTLYHDSTPWKALLYLKPNGSLSLYIYKYMIYMIMVF